MDLDADMVSDEAKNALGVCRRDADARVLQPAGEAVDPQPAVGIKHDFDDARVFEVARNRGPQRGAQHARATGEGFRTEGNRRHTEPREVASTLRRLDQRG